MREDLRQLSAEIRTAIVEWLCTELDLDEDDLRALLRQDIEESMVEEPMTLLKSS